MKIIFIAIHMPLTYNGRIMAKQRLPREFRDYLAKIGRKGGKVGGTKRAANMTAEERSEAARKAVQARWAKEKAKKELQ
jgi:hypothetical protein